MAHHTYLFDLAIRKAKKAGNPDNVQLADKIMLCLQSMHSSILRKGNFNFIFLYDAIFYLIPSSL